MNESGAGVSHGKHWFQFNPRSIPASLAAIASPAAPPSAVSRLGLSAEMDSSGEGPASSTGGFAAPTDLPLSAVARPVDKGCDWTVADMPPPGSVARCGALAPIASSAAGIFVEAAASGWLSGSAAADFFALIAGSRFWPACSTVAGLPVSVSADFD